MFRDNLVQLRKMLNMTQEELAEKVGVSRQAVAKWERDLRFSEQVTFSRSRT